MQKSGIEYFELLKTLSMSSETPIEDEFYIKTFDDYSDLLASQRKGLTKLAFSHTDRDNQQQKLLSSAGFAPSKESLYEILKPTISNFKKNPGPRLLIIYFILEFYHKLYYPITNSFEDPIFNLEFLYNLPIQINFLNLNESLRNQSCNLSRLLLDKIRKNLTIFWPVILLPANLLRLDLTKYEGEKK
jgi:hypothetical protein